MTEKKSWSREDLPYRHRAVVVVFNQDGKFLIAQHTNYEKDKWTFTGGGKEEGETIEEAAKREFTEETGGGTVSIIATSQHTPSYEWTDENIIRFHEVSNLLYRGQIQHFVLAFYDGNPAAIKPNDEEIREFKWVPFAEISNHFKFPGQWETTEPIVKELLQTLEDSSFNE